MKTPFLVDPLFWAAYPIQVAVIGTIAAFSPEHPIVEMVCFGRRARENTEHPGSYTVAVR